VWIDVNRLRFGKISQLFRRPFKTSSASWLTIGRSAGIAMMSFCAMSPKSSPSTAVTGRESRFEIVEPDFKEASRESAAHFVRPLDEPAEVSGEHREPLQEFLLRLWRSR
jgi:hypothetical protein